MATTAAILDILVKADTDKATASLRRVDSSLEKTARTARTAGAQMDKSMSRTATSSRRVTDHNDKLAKSSSRVGGALKAAGGAAVGAAAAYIGISEAKTAITVTEDLAKATISLNQNLGLGVKVASEYAAVAASRGVDSNKLGMAFKTLSKQIVAANDGSTTSVDLFKKLGFSQKEMKKGANDVGFAVKNVADGLQKLGPGADRAAAAGTLFGRGWQPLIPILRDGSKGLQEQLDLANKYGATFGGKSVKSIQDLIAAQRELKIAQMGLQIQFTENIAPALIKAGLAVAGFIHQMDTGRGAGGKFAEVMRGVGQGLKVLWKVIKVVVDAIRVAVNVVKWLVNAFQKLPGPIQKLILALPVLPFYLFAKAAKFVIDRLGGLREAFGWVVRAAKNLGQGIAAGVQGGLNAVIGFINSIISVLNKIPFVEIGSVGKIGGGGGGGGGMGGVNKQHHSKTAGKHTGGGAHRQTGGIMVPGQGDGDKVPALLEPGEVVWNKKAVAQIFGGAHQANRVNTDIPRFAFGDVVGDIASSALHSPFSPVGQAEIQIAGAKAAAGYAKAAAGYVAKKGVGFALNHLPMNLPGWLSPLGDGLMSGAVAYGKKKEAASGGKGGPVPAGSPRNWLTKALKFTHHYTPANLSGLYKQMMSESGGNPKAINLTDSNAAAGHPSKGLLQTIDSTFNAYKAKGHGDIWNPIDNAIAAINYMFATYGHIVSTGSGYQRGGIVGMQKGGIAKLAKGGYVQGAIPPSGKAIKHLGGQLFAQGFNATDGQRSSGGTYHQAGKALDWGDSVNDLGKLWSVVYPVRSKLLELFGPPGLYHGAAKFSDAALQSQHNDHIHTATDKMIDLGGGKAGATVSAAGKAKAPKLTKADKRKARHDKLAKAIEAAKKNAAVLDVDPATAARIGKLQGDVEQFEEYAGYAADLGLDDAMGSYRGQSEQQLLEAELTKLFELRDVLAAAFRVMRAVRDQLADQVAKMRDRLHKLVAIPAAKRTKHQREQITALRPQIAGAVTSLQGLRAKIGTDSSSGEGVLGLLAGVQGTGGPFGIRSGAEQFGGQILQTQLALRDLGAKGLGGLDSSAALDIQKTLAQDWEKRYLVSQAQYPVLQNFGGSFATGGVVPGPIGQPMMIEAHGGETVTPVGAAPEIHVHVDPAMSFLRDYIRVEVGKQGRRSTRGVGRTPGSAGSLRG